MAREFHSQGKVTVKTRSILFAYCPGLHVIATARNTDQIKDLEDLGMSTLALDVTSPESLAAAKTAVEGMTGGKLHILVNNAYFSLFPPLSNLPTNYKD